MNGRTRGARALAGAVLALGVDAAAPVQAEAQELLPVQPGMAVVTRAPTLQPEVVLLLDIRDPECDPAAVLEEAWPCGRDGNALPNPTGLASDAWTHANLGPVFGVTLDDATPPSIYVTSSSAFRAVAGASGRVLRLDGTTGAVTTFATLPNTGVGLGNACFDRVRGQFFVTNMEDGRIYRLDRAGATLSSFDPFLPDDGTAGFAPLGDRAWGVQVFEPENRLYFGTWREDQARRVFRPNQVWSVALDDCGDFAGTERLEITLDPIPARDFTEPVTDISFSAAGRMLLAERTMQGELAQDAHDARVLEYVQVAGAWVPSGRSYQVGAGIDATGGVDWAECVPQDACASAQPHALATGDRLVGNGAGAVHGLQILPLDGGTPADSYLVNFAMDKRAAGDVAYARHPDCPPVPQCAATAALVAGEPCEAQPVTLDAGAGSAVRCCGGLEHRFLDPDGRVARDWDAEPIFTPTVPGTWTVESRCVGSPACVASDSADVAELVSDPWTELEVRPATTCARDTYVLHVVPGSFGACSAPSYQWFQEGVEIPGATGDSHALPDTLPAGDHSFHYVVACPEPLRCGNVSAPRVVAVADPPGPPAVAVSVEPPVGCARATTTLSLDPATLPSCADLGFQWLEDGAPVPGALGPTHVVPASVPSGRHEYQVALTCSQPLPCGDLSGPVEVVLVDPPPGPLASLREEPGSSCDRLLQELSVVPGSFGDCTAPSYQWHEDGLPIPGATGEAHVVPATTPVGEHDYHVVVTCPEPLPCGDTSPPIRVSVADPPVGPRVTLEVEPARGCARDTLTLSVVPDSWGPCSAPAFQWLEDGMPIPGATGATHVVPASTPAGPHRYHYLVTCPEPLPCGDASPFLDVTVVDPPPGPRILHDHAPATPCSAGADRLRVEPGSFGPCSLPEYQWQEDGADVPGATGDAFEVPAGTPPGPHRYRYVVTCPEPLRCGRASPWVDVVVEAPPSSAVAGAAIDGLLHVRKFPVPSRVATDLDVRWGDAAAGAAAYQLYEGTIGTWYDHAGRACHLSRTPPGATEQETRLAMRSGDAYYLVAPADCLGEGTLGGDSFGRARPVPGSGAACGPSPP